jgi:hypothetical protein
MIIGNKRKHFKVIPDDMILKEAEIPLSQKCKKVWAFIKVKVLDVKKKDGEWTFISEGFLSKRKIAKKFGMSVDTVSRCLEELRHRNMVSYGNEPKKHRLKDNDGNFFTYTTPENFIKVNTDTEKWALELISQA